MLTFSDSTLRNTVTGIVAHENVNVHNYDLVAHKIIHNMIGQSAYRYSFRRKDKAITLGQASAVKIAHDQTIDS